MGRSSEIIEELRRYDSEREWFEFKENWFKADELGEYIWALSNSADIILHSHVLPEYLNSGKQQ